MLSALMMESPVPHEIVSAFDALGLPLAKTLSSMLNEAPEHRKPRRGCGYTQASRFLADIINDERGLSPERDLRLFAEVAQRDLVALACRAQRCLGRLPTGITELRTTLETHVQHEPELQQWITTLQLLVDLPAQMEREESRLLASIMLSILGRSIPGAGETEISPYPEKLPIGTCPEAERYFLEFGGGYVRRQGLMNVLVDDQDKPILIEKINIGDNHSCISLRPIRFNGVSLPSGCLFGTTYTSLPIDTRCCSQLNGAWLPLTHCEGFRFLRLTTLAVSPANRVRAYSSHMERQLDANPFFDPLNIRLHDLRSVAQRQYPQTQSRYQA